MYFCSGAGNEAPLALGPDLAQSSGAFVARLRLPESDGKPRAARARSRNAGEGLLRLSPTLPRRDSGSLRLMPCLAGHRSSHDHGHSDCPADYEGLVPPGIDRAGLHGLPQRSSKDVPRSIQS